MESINFSVPSSIENKITISDLYQNIGASGRPTSYGIDLSFQELQLRKSLRSRELVALVIKLEDTLVQWEQKYRRHLEQQYTANRAEEAQTLNDQVTEQIEQLNELLASTLVFDDTINWDSLKSKSLFSVSPADLCKQADTTTPSYISFNRNGKPTNFTKIDRPTAPSVEDAKNAVGFFARLFSKSKVEEKLSKMTASFSAESARLDKVDENRKVLFERLTTQFEQLKGEFKEHQEAHNSSIDALHQRYMDGDPGAIEEHIDIVFRNSKYPEFFPRNWETEYRQISKTLIVNLELPSPDQMPKNEAYRYVKSRDAVDAKAMSDAKRRKLYDLVIYQTVLRTLHEIFESDAISCIEAAVVNGYVDSINPATGKDEVKVIASVSALKEVFEAINLSNIDPKATFKHLKGVSAAKLIDLAAVPPVVQLETHDKRFIEGQAVAESLDEGSNIAAMDWQDFEHLIRELFEAEFSSSGGEVKVTQASRDGGVDAIAFDPDPIRGGKIAIQAKRYTNTVDVSAVRDLYGTVVNEGASRGVLVTTSDYGKDAYEFAKDKPLTLLNGSNLLSLLEKHGHNARINIAEAKKQAKR